VVVPAARAGVEVVGPAPSVQAGVSVGVGVAVPPPPTIHAGFSAGVVVGAPPPVVVVPSGVVVEERVHVIKVKEHHDNGRKRGHDHDRDDDDHRRWK
jgi:hypothetical protein